MPRKSYLLLPCAFFFAEGQYRLGFTALLMQLSLVMWPSAVRLVRVSREQNGVDRLLAEFADRHGLPVDPYAKATKKFRQTA